MAAFTDAWNEAYPAGTTPANQLDTAIAQSVKRAFRERLTVDHDVRADEAGAEESRVPAGTIGYHKKVTLTERSANPDTVVGAGILFVKDVSDVLELFFKDDAGNVLQLTSGGAFASHDDSVNAKAGDLQSSSVDTARTGWTEVTDTYNGKFMRVSSGTPLEAGGSDTHTHTIAEANLPAHSHAAGTLSAGSSGDHSHSIYGVGGMSGSYNGVSANCGTNKSDEPGYTNGSTMSDGSHTHTVSGSTGTTGSGTAITGDNVPSYFNITLFKKD